MLVIEQILSCDLCGREIRRLKQEARHGSVAQIIEGPSSRVVSGGTHDVCADCYEPLMEAFRHIRLANQMKVPD